MKLKKLLLTGLVASILPTLVNAETFNYGDKIYDLSKRDISCTENLQYEGSLKDGTLVYINPNANSLTEVLIKFGIDNKCTPISEPAEMLEIATQLDYNLYEIWFEYTNPGEEGFYHTIDRSAYIKEGYAKATTYISETEYYEYDKINHKYDLVGKLDETTFNAGEYYMMANFTLSSSVELKNGVDYYTTKNEVTFTKVEPEDLDVNKILEYYMVTETEWVETKKIKPLSTNLLKVLKEKAYKNHIAVTSSTEKDFYVWGYLDDNYEKFDVLDEEGNILFENISWFTTILDELYAITKDGKTYIYNKNMEVLYTSDKDLQLEELGFSNNFSSLGGENRDLYQLIKTLKEEEKQVEDKTNTIDNPKTGDNIISIIIIAVITVIGLITTILLQRRKKNN